MNPRCIRHGFADLVEMTWGDAIIVSMLFGAVDDIRYRPAGNYLKRSAEGARSWMDEA